MTLDAENGAGSDLGRSAELLADGQDSTMGQIVDSRVEAPGRGPCSELSVFRPVAGDREEASVSSCSKESARPPGDAAGGVAGGVRTKERASQSAAGASKPATDDAAKTSGRDPAATDEAKEAGKDASASDKAADVVRVKATKPGRSPVGARLPSRGPSLRSPPRSASWSGHGRQAGWPWTRGLLAVAVIGPALALGGVAPEVVIAFLILLIPLWFRLGRRSRGTIEVPWPAWIGVAAIVLTALQCAPLPAGVREFLASGIGERIATALAGTGIEAWPSLSPTPADTALEVTRLAGLTVLFIVTAQLPWRFTAGLVSAAGAAVAGLGLLQVGLGVRAIYGVYSPLDVDPTATPALLTSFVNPNHQADLFLLALFAAGGLLVRQGLAEARDASSPETRMLLWSCVLVVGAALLLSLSRGALLALALVAPIALAIAAFSRHAGGGDRSRRGRVRWWPRVAALAAVVAAAVMVAQAGAWAEMRTLANPGQGIADKLRIAADALQLHQLAPLVGVGRGAFIDLFPAVDGTPGEVIHTHLESAPAALWVEWGWAGVAIGVGLAIAFVDALRRVRVRSDGAARAIALLGVAAVALHSLGDFSLEFLGVAAPTVALAGALAGRGRRVGSPRATAVGLLLLLLALPLAVVVAPNTWSKRASHSDLSDLRARPLDAHLHRTLARRSLERGVDPELARHHATVATSLRPGESESWLLRAAAEERLGEQGLATASMRRALATLDGAPSPALVTYLLGQVDTAAELGELLPEAPTRWAALVSALVAVDPAAGLELAITRSDPPSSAVAPVLEAQVGAALVAGYPALAIHYARLLVQAVPAHANAHLLLARALGASQRPRREEIRRVLTRALDSEVIDDPAELGLLEEALLGQLIDAAAAGDAEALSQAQGLASRLRQRPGDRAALQRRYALQEETERLAAARGREPR